MEVFGSSLKTGSTSMAELIQAKKVYYSTVEGFITSDPPLLNLRRMVDHMKRERHMYLAVRASFTWRMRKHVETL